MECIFHIFYDVFFKQDKWTVWNLSSPGLQLCRLYIFYRAGLHSSVGIVSHFSLEKSQVQAFGVSTFFVAQHCSPFHSKMEKLPVNEVVKNTMSYTVAMGSVQIPKVLWKKVNCMDFAIEWKFLHIVILYVPNQLSWVLFWGMLAVAI